MQKCESLIFSWLHLSDIHFGHGDEYWGWDQKHVLTSLIQDVQKRVGSRPNPGTVFITGDIAFSGATVNESEYLLAKNWIDNLITTLNLSNKNIFCVPGNHDVQRSIYNSERNTKRLIDSLRDGSDKIDSCLANNEDRIMLERRFNNYLKFISNYGPKNLLKDLFWSYSLEANEGFNLNIIGLNSALTSQDDSDEKKLLLGNQQLLSNLPNLSNNANSITFTLMHHPLSWLSDYENASQIVRKYSNIHMSGHIHNLDSEHRQRGAGTSYIELVAGAVHQESKEIGGHSYSIGGLYYDKSSKSILLRTWPRNWSKENAEFRSDVNKIDEDLGYAEHVINMNNKPIEPMVSFKNKNDSLSQEERAFQNQLKTVEDILNEEH